MYIIENLEEVERRKHFCQPCHPEQLSVQTLCSHFFQPLHSYHILLCIMCTHAFGPNFQAKISFILILNPMFYLYIKLIIVFQGIICIQILLLLSRVILLMHKHK